MATQHHSAFTQTLLDQAEGRYPTLTLRLSSARAEAENAVFDIECEQAKQQIVDEVKQALDADVEKTRLLLKTLKPSREGKTDAEYGRAVERFRQSLSIIKGLIEEQTQFNGLFLTRVGNYLVEAWRMLQRGDSDSKVKKYRKEQKQEMEKDFEEQSKSTQKRVQREIEGNQSSRHGAYAKAPPVPQHGGHGPDANAPSVPHHGQGAHAQGNGQQYQQGGHGHVGYGRSNSSQGGQGQVIHPGNADYQRGYEDGQRNKNYQQGAQGQGGDGRSNSSQGGQGQVIHPGNADYQRGYEDGQRNKN